MKKKTTTTMKKVSMLSRPPSVVRVLRTNGDGGGGGLDAGLSAAAREELLVLVAVVGETEGRPHGHHRTQHAGHAVKVVDTADVLNAEPAEERGEVFEAKHGDDAGDEADADGSRGVHVETGGDAHDDASGQRRVLDVHAVEAVAGDQARDDERGGRRGAQADEGVEERTVLPVVVKNRRSN